MKRLSKAAERLSGQPMFILLDKIKRMEALGKDVVHFEIGDPEFDTPKEIVHSCIDALYAGHTHYTSSDGDLDLRKEIRFHTGEYLGFFPTLEQIIVSPGSNVLIYALIKCLVNEDEIVLVPDPGFPTYTSVLDFLGIEWVSVPLKEEYNFRMMPHDVCSIIKKQRKKVGMVIVNSPNNPTGSVNTEEDMKKLNQLSRDFNFYLLSDEIYNFLSYDSPPTTPTPAFIERCKDRVIVITGFSKAFAMTGWRLGYMIAPEFIAEKVSLLLQTLVSCVSPFIQKSAIPALKNTQEKTENIRSNLKANRDFMVQELNKMPGISCKPPAGAFYIFANIKDTGLSSQQFSDVMLMAGVAILPGPNFGNHGEGYVRLCYATSIDNIKEGMNRMYSCLTAK